MTREKSRAFQMRATPEWLSHVDEWRRTQADLPARAEAVRRLVEMGLRFGLKEGDRVSTPEGDGKVTAVRKSIGHVNVKTKDGGEHIFSIGEVRVPT